jgi:hypothetical protein
MHQLYRLLNRYMSRLPHEVIISSIKAVANDSIAITTEL